MPTQRDQGIAFRELHQRDRAFIIPNPWDVGTARLLARLGFEALATTSAGYAFSVGRRDNTIGRDEMLAHAAAIASATELPVSADLENGFGDDPETVAETIRLAAATGVVGGSIEDLSGRSIDQRIYDTGLAVDRIRAAAEAARGLPFPFTLTARAENYLVGTADLADTIARLQAYQDAGADVLYAPGITSREDIAAVVRSVDRPVNVVMGLGVPQRERILGEEKTREREARATKPAPHPESFGAPGRARLGRELEIGDRLDLAVLSALGVKRISVGSALARAALGAFLRAARELRERGSFDFADQAVSYAEISAMF